MGGGALKTVRLRVEGRVQGVGFRAWTTREATARGLGGWVRNRADGSVEAVLAGPPDAVDEMTALCHQGPSVARVTKVSVSPEPDSLAPGFRQLPTE
jgi:acylphosphatase